MSPPNSFSDSKGKASGTSAFNDGFPPVGKSSGFAKRDGNDSETHDDVWDDIDSDEDDDVDDAIAKSHRKDSASKLQLRPHCATCDKTTAQVSNLLRCGRCKTTRYCSRACQKANWKAHKKVCAALAGMADNGPARIASEKKQRFKETWECDDGVGSKSVKPNFSLPMYGDEDRVEFGGSEEWDPTKLRAGVHCVEFRPGFKVEDSHLEALATASYNFRTQLKALYCGSPDIAGPDTIPITDAAIEKLVKACPNIEHIRISNGSHLTEPLKPIMHNCRKITSISLSAAKGTNTLLRLEQESQGALDDLLEDPQMCPRLKFMEFHNLKIDMERKNFLGFLTMARSFQPRGLEIVWGDPAQAIVVLFRDGREFFLEGAQNVPDWDGILTECLGSGWNAEESDDDYDDFDRYCDWFDDPDAGIHDKYGDVDMDKFERAMRRAGAMAEAQSGPRRPGW